MSDKDPYGEQPPPSGWQPAPGEGQQGDAGDQPTQWGAQPPPQYGGGYEQYPQQQSSFDEAKGFFAALFDFSFTHFVTPQIVKVVYILATIGLSLLFVFFLITAFVNEVDVGFVVLLIGPIVFLVYQALVRMTLEFYFALVRMSEDIHQRLPR